MYVVFPFTFYNFFDMHKHIFGEVVIYTSQSNAYAASNASGLEDRQLAGQLPSILIVINASGQGQI
jgi:hypothetical protein